MDLRKSTQLNLGISRYTAAREKVKIGVWAYMPAPQEAVTGVFKFKSCLDYSLDNNDRHGKVSPNSDS